MGITGAPAVTSERILQMAWGYSAPLMIEAGIRNGLFDALDGEPKSLTEVVRITGASARGLRATMNALAGLGLLSKDSDDRYGSAADAAAFLVRGKPGYIGGFLQHTSTQLIPFWLKLSDVVKVGKPSTGGVNQEQVGTEFFQQFVEDLFPLGYPAAQALARELGLADAKEPTTVLDLAAGSGVWGIGLAQASELVHVTALDWPGVLDVTRKAVSRFGLENRFSFVGGNLLKAEFGSGHDIAVLGHILHSEGEKRSRQLLRKVFQALAPGGTIAISEFLVEDDRSGPPMGLVFAVNMLIATEEGDTWSFNEIAGWLREVGFENARTMTAPAPSPLILANRPR